MKYTKEQIIRSERCQYIRDIATLMGRFNWGDAIRFVRSRLASNSLREANEVLYVLGIRK